MNGQDFAAALLTGGHSTRMGVDKASLPWQGQWLWQHQVQLLKRVGFQDIWISCREEQAELFSGHPSLAFDQAHQSGPLSAIANVLAKTTKATFVLGIDMPLIHEGFIANLLEGSEHGRISAVYQQKDASYVEPLAAWYSESALPLLLEMEAKGEKRLQSFWRQLLERNLAKVLIPSEDLTPCFTNFNTADQWSQHQSPPNL